MPSIPKIADGAMAPGRQEQREQPRPNPTLECRNFWRAGSSIAPASASTVSRGSVRTSDFDYARVHPKFLHTNATSHKWAFGAIAELLDNAVDEICNGATFVKVDKINNLKDNSPILLFQDDGGGMDPEGVRRCMSLGFSTKKSKTTIGQYGNGFKTSTMRLGADAIVFSRAIRDSRVTQSIGLLSYTYLRRTMKDDIVVPMIDFQILEDQVVPFLYSSQDDWDADLKTILEWSPFSSKEELLQQFKDLGLHGTKVLIYNLWMNDDGLLELDFDDEAEDILLRDYANNEGVTRPHKDIVQLHISYTLKHSLRAYASILYLRKFTNFQIILRGVPVQQINMADEIKFKKVVTYKPQVGVNAEVVTVRTTLGFAKEAPVLGIFGFNVYHKNRLIMPFWKVLQEGSSRGRSVVGVLEANFIEPAHDKQDFERTPLFIRLELKLKHMVLEYWKDHCHLIGYQSHVTRAMQKGSGKHSGVVPKMPREVLSAGVHQESQIEEPVIEPNADFEDATYVVPIIRLSPANGSTVLPSEQKQVPDFVMRPSELAEDCVAMDTDALDPTSIEKIIEENLQLYERRHELQTRQTELKQTVEELERDLQRMKKKTLQLASELEHRKRKQHPAGQ